MGSKGSAPSADPQIGRAAIMQAELGNEYLTFAKQQYADQTVRNDKLDDLSSRVAEAQLDASTQAQQWASEDRDRYQSVFQPLQDDFVAEAKKYGSQEYQDQAASEARADVINAATGQAQQRQRQMAAMGVSPTSGRYSGIERASDVQVSLGAAGAENNARQLARDKALALTSDAINLGNGLPSSAASSLGLGVNAGSSAVSTSTVPISTANQSLGVLQSGYGTAMNGYAGQANTLNSLYQNQLSSWQAQQQASGGLFNTLGTVAGAAIMASSKDYKEDKAPARGVLEAVRNMPVETWTYKKGIADEGRHIGPYAEDFQAATGKGDGKSIPVVDAIGVTLGAIRELDEKVSKMERGAIRKDKGRKAA
jgi:hypothetical protein